ncbi:DNA-3-methyladenine glycosylase family protein [Caloramator mitchellensis]
MTQKTNVNCQTIQELKKSSECHLEHIFECGQCFRWNKYEDGYIGVAGGKVVYAYEKDDVICLEGAKEEDKNFWWEYFDLGRDYGEIKRELEKDEILKEAIKYGYGIRILKQEPFETLISFIISANNRIPMIKRAVENISIRFGDRIEFRGMEFYAFPTVEQLARATVGDLEDCGTGFRAPYIAEAVRKIIDEKIDLEEIKKLDTDEAMKKLMEFKGVGPKVADCVLLFSMQKFDAFPVDVWVKKIMQKFYLAPDVSLNKIRQFGKNKFGDLAGFAQQYLFYYARENKV